MDLEAKQREEKRTAHIRVTPTTRQLAQQVAESMPARHAWSLTDVVEAAVRMTADAVEQGDWFRVEQARQRASEASQLARYEQEDGLSTPTPDATSGAASH